MRKLERRTVLVTGATSGIGLAVARRCADEGARVFATGRDEARLSQLTRSYASVVGHAADLSTGTSADECVNRAMDAFGTVDGLFHSAGIVRRQEDVRKTTDEQWAYMMQINLEVSFRIARACLPVMTTRGGSIVFVGSALAHVGAPGHASYSASKGAIEAFVRSLAVDFGPCGIRVNVLSPGVVATPLAYVDRPDFDNQVESIAARLPLRRIGKPEDMTGPAVFLLSEDSAWMTGQSLIVDGGFSIQ